MRRIAVVFSSLLAAACSGGAGGDLRDAAVSNDAPLDGQAFIGPDADGDGIADRTEGAPSVDTDSDGSPDYQDIDSDDDGLNDDFERGTAPGGQPIDSDNDGTQDFRDRDSDNNGVEDHIEGARDLDHDGDGNFCDADNDGDAITDVVEIGAPPSTPDDFDSDGTADYFDLDSDNDTISDREEGSGDGDLDRDESPNRHDADSDDDEISDSEEAGDADVETPARDTDNDAVADYRDPDSDNDGLSDRHELASGINPYNADTDGDGVSDLIEVGGCPVGEAGCANDATDASASPRTRGDFVFVVPHMAAPSPERDTLSFSTVLQRADVYFLMDNTGSMGSTILALQAGLRDHVIPDTMAIIPDAWFGVAGFDDYPINPYGLPSNTRIDSLGLTHDLPFFQYTTVTNDVAALQAAVNVYRVNSGGDRPESGVAALFSLATRDTLSGNARFPGVEPPTCPEGRSHATACFRDDAIPIVVMMTDVDQHNSPTCTVLGCDYVDSVPGTGPTYASTVEALTALNIRIVGIATAVGARTFLERLVTDTTIALGATGSASDYVLEASVAIPLTSAVADAIEQAAVVPLAVSARLQDVIDEDETVDAVAAFVATFETHNDVAPVGSMRLCTGGFTVEDRDGIDEDANNDTFNDVTPGTPVCFDIVPKMNTTVPATNAPQLYRARIDVIGDGFTPLDSREVYFLVPPQVRVSGPIG